MLEAAKFTSRSGLHNGTFTIFSSDHCPFAYGTSPHGKMSGILEHEPTMSMAQQSHPHPDVHQDESPTTDWTEFAKDKIGSFRLIPNGIPGVETRLPLLFTRGVEEGRISPMKFVELTATNPAKLVSAFGPSCILDWTNVRGADEGAYAVIVWPISAEGNIVAWIRRRSRHCKAHSCL